MLIKIRKKLYYIRNWSFTNIVFVNFTNSNHSKSAQSFRPLMQEVNFHFTREIFKRQRFKISFATNDLRSGLTGNRSAIGDRNSSKLNYSTLCTRLSLSSFFNLLIIIVNIAISKQTPRVKAITTT